MKDSLFEKIIKYLCIILFILFTLGPLIWCFVITITPEYEMLKNTTSFLPSEIYWGNYKEIFDATTKSHEVLFGGLMNFVMDVEKIENKLVYELKKELGEL